MNCLIFGYGYMGKIRRQVLAKHPDVDRIFVVEPNAGSAEGLGDDLISTDAGIPWHDVDAVFVCTPNNVTPDICVEALERCGQVFCEKPPGRDWADFRRIENAAAARPDHRLVFGFNHRLHPSIQSAKALIGDGGLGDILFLKGTYGKSGGSEYRDSWRNDVKVSGGGILIDQGIHMLDLFHFLLGGLCLRDAALVDSFWGCGVEDNAFVLLESAKGVPAFLHSSATLWKHTFRVEIGCAHGYLVASGFLSKTGSYGREQLVIGKRQFEGESSAVGNPREEIVHFDRDDSWDKEVDEFITSIKEGRAPTHGTLAEARHAMELIRDIYALPQKRLEHVRG